MRGAGIAGLHGGQARLRYPVRVFVAHYDAERPHQARGNVPLPDADGPPVLRFPAGEVRCRERLGGRLRHDHRAARVGPEMVRAAFPYRNVPV